jgi:hypothetical protein
MRHTIIKLIICSFALILIPYTAQAITGDEAKLKVFTDACVGSWMKDSGTDQSLDNRFFGERFCTCAGKHMMPTLDRENVPADEMEAAKTEATSSCLSQSVLEKTINSLSKNETLTEDHLKTTCMKSWGFIFTGGLNSDQQLYAQTFCNCSASPLAVLGDRSKLSDDQLTDKVAGISAGCTKLVGPLPIANSSSNEDSSAPASSETKK